MLIGGAGGRKSSAIKLSKKLMAASGYSSFARDKTTKEKFLLDLSGLGEEFQGTGKKSYDAVLSQNLWGSEDDNGEPKEVFIAADEFNEFTTPGNGEFYTTLGTLWDWDDQHTSFSSGVKNSQSPAIFQPTVSLLGGNTQEGFAEAFPANIIGKGFFSRLILVHGERSGRKLWNPPAPTDSSTERIVDAFKSLRATRYDRVVYDASGEQLLAAIYDRWVDMDDVRFKSYNSRRFTQLLKLCIICLAAMNEEKVNDHVVITANTYLAAAERNMPRALGEFGKNKNSDVAQKIMDILANTRRPLMATDLWSIGQLHTDVENILALQNILEGLERSQRIQRSKAPPGFLPKVVRKEAQEFVDWSLLTQEEREMI